MSERMQSLLSRAVEDQLSEQRSLAGALADVRTQIATLSQTLAAAQLNPASPDTGSGAGLTAELREAMRRTGDRLDTVARMVAQRGEDIVALQASLSVLSDQLRAQGEGVAAMSGSVTTVAQRVEGIATYLGDRSAGDGSRLAGIEQRLVALQTDMTAVGSYVAGLVESSAARGEGNAEDLDARIRAIVAGALVGTERRLAAHVDETVLTLAEALLRPRAIGQDAVEAAGTEPLLTDGKLSDLAARAEAAAASTVAPEGPGPVPVNPIHGAAPDHTAPAAHPVAQPLVDPSAVGMAPPASDAANPDTADRSAAAAATAEDANPPEGDPAGASSSQPQNGVSPQVPPPWTTVDTDDADRRRGWFRSRD
jgi:hypothetical protein